MANIDTLKGKLTAIANAIRQKTGRSALLDLDEMPTEILSIDGGGGDVPNPDDPLLLVDWDGTTLLYSYTYEDAQLISEFPDAPVHDGLTFQSWNWSEVIAKTWLQNHRGAQLRVGATYTPTDGQDHNYWRSPREVELQYIYKQHRATATIGMTEFNAYRSLSEISIPQGITQISSNAFRYCNSLIAIILPNSLTIIGPYAFQECFSLIAASLPSSLTTINEYAFTNCRSLAGINLPSSLTSIAAGAFAGCVSLKTIILPNSITAINSYTFNECCSLFEIVLPTQLTTIDSYAFYGCYSLYKIDILSSITYIGNFAFQYCRSLMDIIVRGKPTLGGSSVFYDNTVAVNANQRFYVHRSDLSWFETATNWSAIYGEGKIVAAADYIEYLQSIGIDTTDFEGE